MNPQEINKVLFILAQDMHMLIEETFFKKVGLQLSDMGVMVEQGLIKTELNNDKKYLRITPRGVEFLLSYLDHISNSAALILSLLSIFFVLLNYVGSHKDMSFTIPTATYILSIMILVSLLFILIFGAKAFEIISWYFFEWSYQIRRVLHNLKISLECFIMPEFRSPKEIISLVLKNLPQIVGVIILAYLVFVVAPDFLK